MAKHADSLDIADNWMTGLVYNSNLVAPVVHARLILDSWTDDRARAAWDAIEGVFELWKTQKGQVPAILGGRDGVLEELMPWQCAGDTIEDPVDLARKLEGDDYPPFKKFLTSVGDSIANVYAVICLRYASRSEKGRGYGLKPRRTRGVFASSDGDAFTALKAIHFASLYKAEDYRRDFVRVAETAMSAIRAKRKQSAGLAEATRNSAERRKRARENEQDTWRKMAAEKWPDVPEWINLDMAEWIEANTKTTKAISSIEKAIQGVKLSALRRARQPKDGQQRT